MGLSLFGYLSGLDWPWWREEDSVGGARYYNLRTRIGG
jgi:hypothetical protein